MNKRDKNPCLPRSHLAQKENKHDKDGNHVAGEMPLNAVEQNGTLKGKRPSGKREGGIG